MNLKERVIAVTGGTGVLGASFIKAIHDEGGKVCIIGRNLEVAEQRAHDLCPSGSTALAVKADVLDEDQLKKAFDKIVNHFGRIDGLVNAAGGNMPEGILEPEQDIFEMNITGMQSVMNLNLWGTIIPTQVFGKSMAINRGGSIVNISSMSSLHAITRVMGYSLGKAAIENYTRWFAVEVANRYGDKIRMNAIAPGFFLTEQNRRLLTNSDGTNTDRTERILQNTPFKRFGSPDELSGALVWLLSDASKFVTGTVITVDGGFSIFSGV